MDKLIIVGGGVAGLTAAIYAARAELSPIVLESSVWGGQIISAPKIENYPALPGIAGSELSQRLKKQAEELGVRFVEAQALRLERLNGAFVLHTDKESYHCRAVIVATGASRRQLGCPGEAELAGRGISYCAVCDGALYKGRDVAVIGGGNSAFEEAWHLSGLCRSVFLIHRKPDFRASGALVRRLRTRSNVKFLNPYLTTAILGDEKVSGVELKSIETGSALALRVDGVFVCVGLKPQNDFCSGVAAIDKAGYLYAGEDCRTDVPGLFAAGDCRAKPLRQLVTAMADGAVAATAAEEFLRL